MQKFDLLFSDIVVNILNYLLNVLRRQFEEKNLKKSIWNQFSTIGHWNVHRDEKGI